MNLKTLVGWCGGSLLVIASLAAANAAANNDLRLLEAVKNRDEKAVRAMLAESADVNVSQGDGTTALHWAAQWDDLETANLLIRAGAHVNRANDYGVTPLSLACTNGSAAMVEKLLKAGADPDAGRSSGETALMTCARTGGVKALQTLLVHGADVHAKEPSRGQTALMWAAAEGHAAVVQTLIEHGADVHTRSTSQSGYTPLLFAAGGGDVNTVRVLLESGADVNEVAADGSTALLTAAVLGKTTALATFLLAQGADPNAAAAGYTALHWAAGEWETSLTGQFGITTTRPTEWNHLAGRRGQEKQEFVKALLAHGANPNARLTKLPPRFGYSAPLFQHLQNANAASTNVTMESLLVGGSPFLLAALAGDAATMRILADAGADPVLASDAGLTPAMAAAGIGRIMAQSDVTESSALEAVRLAVHLGGDVNAVSREGDTALFGAAYTGATTIAQYLIDKGAQVNVRNKRGETPLMITEGKGPRVGATNLFFEDLADLLRRLGAKE